MRNKFCPKLPQIESSTSLYIKNLPTDRTKFEIEWNGRVFKVKQVKLYNFLEGSQSQGTVLINWKIFSRHSKVAKAKLWATDFHVTNTTPSSIDLFEHFITP